jgi:hypothetical protein
VAALWLGATAAFAHNPDTSYARVHPAANHVEVRLTYDLFTLLKVAPLDADQDRRVTREELRRAAPALERFLRGAVVFEINGQPADLGNAGEPSWPADSGEAVAAADWHSAAGLVTFPFRHAVAAPPKDVALGFDFWETFGERHTVLGVFEQDGRTHEVIFSRHEPDFLFDAGTTQRAGEAGAGPGARTEPLGTALLRFLKLGVEHIFLGYDHICFLVALIVVSRLGELIKIVTSFTVAHSVTLILAALQVVTLPTRLIECAIALTIIYVAAENLWLKTTRHRWLLTFGFGLVHGFGFANVLAGLGLPPSGTVRCLLSFNVGVELGQLAIVLLLLPVTWALERWQHGRKAVIGLSVAVGVFGLGWFAERAFSLRFMPL